MSKTTKCPSTANEVPSAQVNGERRGGAAKFLKWILAAIVTYHLSVAAGLFVNLVSHPEILSSSDAWHMLYYHQFSQGGHCYYAKDDLAHTSDGYTPLASEIFGLVIRFFGDDIRWVRMTSGLFGFAGMILAGLCVYRLSGGNRFFAYVAAGLSPAVEMCWFIEVGPNTIHAVFALLGLYLLLRDPSVSWRTMWLVLAALFACFWSKQTGLGYLAAGAFYIFLQDWRKGLAFSLTAALMIVVGVRHYIALEGSQFYYWVFQMNQDQPLILSRLLDPFLSQLISKRFVILVSFIFAGLVFTLRNWKSVIRPEHVFLGAAAIVGPFASCKYGSGFPQMYFFFQMLIVCGVAFAARFVTSFSAPRELVLMLFCMQGLALAQDFNPFLINQEDVSRYNQIMLLLKTPGKAACYINRGYLGLLAGKGPFPNAGEDCWVGKTYHPEILSKARRDFLQKDPWDIVIIDVPLEDGSFFLYDRLNKSYKLSFEIPPSTLYPSYGYDIRRKMMVLERKQATEVQQH